MITLKEIKFSQGGKRVDYHYSVSGKAKRFIEGAENYYIEYPVDVSGCPLSLLTIPFVSNFEPIGWFAGFDIHVPEIDTDFLQCRLRYREWFAKMYPAQDFVNSVKAERVVSNVIKGQETLMLYSGGMDAATTLARNFNKLITLILVRGADVDVNDNVQWTQLSNHVASQALTKNRRVLVVTTNARKFYNNYVDARLLMGWWGRVQHGGSLLGTLAPLNYVLNAPINIISSSYDIPMAWGSTKNADETLRWAQASCIHDASEISRQDKAAYLVNWRKTTGIDIKLRVCYSEVKRQGNCGRCEKCYRTIMNLVLSGADPRDYGLPFDAYTYDNLLKLMLHKESSPGLIKFWREISSAALKSLSNTNFFVLESKNQEKKFIQQIANGVIDRALLANQSQFRKYLSLIKFRIRTEHPSFYATLLSFRNFFKNIKN